MGVGVDQAGQDRDVAEIDVSAVGVAGAGRCGAPTRRRATMRPRSTATQPSRIGGAPIGRIQAAW